MASDYCRPLLCLSWACAYCQRRKWVAARHVFAGGIRAAWERDEHVRFLTLTLGEGYGALTVPRLGAAWDDLSKLLRAGGPAPKRPPRGSGADEQRKWRDVCKQRRCRLDEYASVIELGGVHGRLHLHALTTGEFIPQKQLSEWAASCGFGKVVDIKMIAAGNEGAIAGYATKMAGYVSKAGQELADELHRRGALRIRPVRTSRRWYPGGLRRAEVETGLRRESQSSDTDGWVVLERLDDGRVRWVPPRR